MAESILDRPAEAPESAPTAPKKRELGCWFWGCITVAALAILVGAVLGIGAYKMYRYAQGFTSETMADLPAHQATQEEYDSILARMEEFKQAVDSGTSGVELMLTGDDINTIIAMDPDLADVRNMAYVRIEGDIAGMDVSIPLDDMPGFSGRYLNGTAEVTASMSAGFLVVNLVSLEVNGKPVPDQFMKGMQQENLAKDLYDDPEQRELLEKVQDIRVENGRIILVSK